METIPKHDMQLMIGDFNAEVVVGNTGYEGVMGKEGVGMMKGDSERLLNVCEVNVKYKTDALSLLHQQ